MARGSPQLEHLLRRAAFGATPDELRFYEDMSQSQAIDYLLNYDRVPDDVDTKIGHNAYVGVTGRGAPVAPKIANMARTKAAETAIRPNTATSPSAAPFGGTSATS